LEYLYLPAAQNPTMGMTLLLETAGPPGDLTGALRETVRSIDSTQPMFGISTMEEFFDQRSRGMVRVLIEVIAGMALLGLLIALVGLYGLMTYSVGLRQREIGIRIAVGAEPSGVLRMMLRHGLVLALTGIAIGLLLTALADRALTAALGMPAFNVPLLVGVVAALVATTGLGSLLPARRASLVDPNIVLRQE
jgi:ABC-type antimicrobial peptide transport system permease subunit